MISSEKVDRNLIHFHKKCCEQCKSKSIHNQRWAYACTAVQRDFWTGLNPYKKAVVRLMNGLNGFCTGLNPWTGFHFWNLYIRTGCTDFERVWFCVRVFSLMNLNINQSKCGTYRAYLIELEDVFWLGPCVSS